MINVSYNNLPEAVEGLYRLFDEVQALRDLLRSCLEQKANPPLQEELLTRKEAASLLKISLVTLSNWTKNGLVKGHRISNKVRYKRSELETSIKSIRIYPK